MDVLLDISLTSDQRGWVALAVAVACVGFLLFRPRFKKKDPLEKAPFSSLSSQRSVEREMQNLLVELSDMTRQMSAQIDTRAQRLEELIKQADQRLAELRQMEIASGTIGHPPMPAPGCETTARISDDPRHAEIYSLADQGQAPKEIAMRLGRPSGEVELILALRPRA